MPHRDPCNIIHEPFNAATKKLLLDATPECAALLADPALESITSGSRDPKASTEDALMAETFATDRTIRVWKCFYRKLDTAQPSSSLSASSASASASSLSPTGGSASANANGNLGVSAEPLKTSASPDPDPTAPLHGEAITLALVGDGLNGHPGVVHGGVLATILDEVMGSIGYMHHLEGTVGFTVVMTVRFLKPAPSPSLLVCRAWMQQRSSGRKIWTKGVIEDAAGTRFSEAEALFLEVPSSRPKL